MTDSEQNTNLKIEESRTRVLKTQEYTKIEELGRGVSGIAFLVQSKEGNFYAVKEINYRDKLDLDRIKEEVKILRSLKHPYIVDYEESFEDEAIGRFFIVMEYCEGGDLYKNMQAQGLNGFFEEQQILDWLVQICLALQHLHENNVLHRDIKPQNVFLTKDGYINLGDFGCSKALQTADIYAKSVVGADLYVSPEVHTQNYNSKSDIWSLGWLLHDLCMLNVWSDLIERSYLHALSKKGNLPPISERYSEELRELIRQMLNCDPENRPSAKEILEKTFLNDAVERNKTIPNSLEQRFMKATEILEETYNEFEDFLSEWKNITDSLENIHRKCTIGSLTGSVIGAAGGITALVGAILIPFTLGVSVIVSGVGIGVGIAGGATSFASNMINLLKQKSLSESFEKLLKYQNVSQLILCSPEILRLLRRIQKFRHLFAFSMFHDLNISWWVERSTFILVHAMCIFGNVGRAGVQAGIQAARVGRAAAVTAEAVAAASGVLSALFLILDVAFIAIDSREIHQINQGEIDDPEKVSSSLLKFIAQMKKTHQEMHNLLREVKETREAITDLQN
ncbi:serine/threonine-protein kinase Nek2-like [Megalobrama amblycephala]|uniref:serine/threonine-protein kinase Nek2-like n=1 Tax=Megalobrama amblycephala TaxID=75352 RepID=UPI0020140EEF|nr:serine/threonine-protein kinase Nek2-like [Megalobrama amblycephala]